MHFFSALCRSIRILLTKFMSLMYKQNVNVFLCNKTFLPHRPRHSIVTWWMYFLFMKPLQEDKSQKKRFLDEHEISKLHGTNWKFNTCNCQIHSFYHRSFLTYGTGIFVIYWHELLPWVLQKWCQLSFYSPIQLFFKISGQWWSTLCHLKASSEFWLIYILLRYPNIIFSSR